MWGAGQGCQALPPTLSRSSAPLGTPLHQCGAGSSSLPAALGGGEVGGGEGTGWGSGEQGASSLQPHLRTGWLCSLVGAWEAWLMSPSEVLAAPQSPVRRCGGRRDRRIARARCGPQLPASLHPSRASCTAPSGHHLREAVSSAHVTRMGTKSQGSHAGWRVLMDSWLPPDLSKCSRSNSPVRG